MPTFEIEENPQNYRVMENYGEYLPIPDVDCRDEITQNDRILLLRLSAIGDALRILPVVEYLRKNGFEGRIDCVVEPPTDELLETYPGLNQVYRLPLKNYLSNAGSILSLITTLRNNDYDWIFDLHGLLKSGVLSRLTGAVHRIGYSRTKSREFNRYFQSAIPTSPLASSMPRILKYIQLLRPFSPNFRFTRNTIKPSLPSFDSSSVQLRNEAQNSPILVHPSSSHSRYGTSKEWGVRNFANFLETALPACDRPVRITWGPGELENARKIASAVDHPRVRPSEETNNLRDLAFQLENASMVITVDTSVAHLADMLGQPLLVIFGGSNHYVHAPLFTNYRFITRRGSEETIEDIPVRRVTGVFRDLWKEVRQG